MDDYILDIYDDLDAHERAVAQQLNFSLYAPQGDAFGYDNAAFYTIDYVGVEAHSVFSFHATEGAVYSISSAGYVDPDGLLVFDDDGYAIADDDSFGYAGTDHTLFVAPYSGIYYVDAGWVAHTYPAHQAATLTILEDRSTLALAVIKGTNRADVMDGTVDDDDLYGYAGADSLFGGYGDDYLDGGAGIDSAYYIGDWAEYDIDASFDRIEVTALETDEGIDLLSNIERLDFDDMTIGLDLNGSAGEAFRLYHAAFDRAPDLVGLGYWIAQLDHGASLHSVAAGFAASAEFRSLYGTGADHVSLVWHLYDNVLNRAPDQPGVDFWVNLLQTRQLTIPEVLVAFSESQENYAQLIGATSEGIAFIPWG